LAQSPPTLNGNLSDFKALVQQIENESLVACGIHQLDNVDNGPVVGADGFQDEPIDRTADPNDRFSHSPINAGDFFFIYFPDSDGVVEPASEDDSWLAVGVNIANGDGDVFDDTNKLLTNPDLPDHIMVPFDNDGDGHPGRLGVGAGSRWFPLNPVATFNEATEAINLRFFLCDGSFPDFEIVYEQRDAGPTNLRVFIDSVEIPTAEIPTRFAVDVFPPNGSTGNSIEARGLDSNTAFPDGLGNDDVEFYIENIDSKVHNEINPGMDFSTTTRLQMADMFFDLRSDSSGDLSNEDSMFTTCFLPLPALEAKKEIRCQGEDETDWREHAMVAVSSIVDLRITVENTGNTDLNVTLFDQVQALCDAGHLNPVVQAIVDSNGVVNTTAADDDIQVYPVGDAVNSGDVIILPGPDGVLDTAPAAGDAIVNTTMTVTLFDEGVNPIPITFLNAGANGLDDVEFFGSPQNNQFLLDIRNGESSHLGTLNGVEACPPTHLGDRVVIQFKASVEAGANFCTQCFGSEFDAANCINASGFYDINTDGTQDADEPGVEDLCGVVDTPCEADVTRCNGDDNVVTVDIHCRDLDFTKSVSLTEGGPFSDSVAVPTTFPAKVYYRYSVTNNGELMETILLDDHQFCADVMNTAGVTFCDACAVCAEFPDPYVFLAPPGVTTNVDCCIEFANEAALLAFVALDDSRPDCNGNDVDPQCYRNCAVITSLVGDVKKAYAPGERPGDGDTSGPLGEQAGKPGSSKGDSDGERLSGIDTVCAGPPIDYADTALICYLQCLVEVTKEVRCLEGPNCTTALGPDEGWVKSLDVAPGSCIQYRVTITNDGPIDLCSVEITDTMTCQGNFAQGPFDVQISGECCANLPADFNWTGGAFDCPVDLAPGESCVFTFKARLRGPNDPLLNPLCDPLNTVQVRGASDCPGGNPAYSCVDTDTADIDILPVDLECVKRYTVFRWDSNADCVPDLEETFTDPTTDLLDKVFPVEVELEVEVTNTGLIALDVTVSDTDLCTDVNSTAGVSFVTCELCPPTGPVTKTLAPGASDVWTCVIRFDTAAAARAFSAKENGRPACRDTRNYYYKNCATASGIMVDDGSGICLPEQPEAVTTTCDALIAFPPPCEIVASKRVVCLDCATRAEIGARLPHIDIVPGGCFRWVIVIENTGTVPIPKVCFRDTLTPAARAWFLTDPCTVLLNGVDVSGCDPTGQAGTSTLCDYVTQAYNTGAERCLSFGGCAGLTDPWIAPGETLEIWMDSQVPPDFNVVGVDPDAVNVVSVDGYTEVCATAPSCEDVDESDNRAEVNVVTPGIICTKSVAADIGNNGSVDIPFSDVINLDQPDFPVRLIYRLAACNNGELPVTNVRVVDLALVPDALAAGATLGACELVFEPVDCTNPGNQCATLDDLAPGVCDFVLCELIFETVDEWNAFAVLDDGGADCYENVSRAFADVDTSGGGLCLGDFNPELESNPCSALVCITAPECPPVTKARFTIWNENEVRFSETVRCIYSWSQELLSRYDAPNFFIRGFLQTNKGKARIEGIASPDVCGDDSIDAPLLGVAAKFLDFGTEIAAAGMPLVGSGSQVGQILTEVIEPPEEGEYQGKGDAGGVLDDPEQQEGTTDEEGLPELEWSLIPAVNVAGISEKGSLLAYVKVEIKWDQFGNVVQDTFLTLNNDYIRGVDVLIYLVNGDPLACNWADNSIRLTREEPAYWSALTGSTKGISPFTVLDADGSPDDDPLNPGGRVLRGYVLAWAVDGNDQEIQWNHLSGQAMLINYQHGFAWDYEAWSFRALAGTAGEGSLLNPPFGQLDLNGAEYEFAPADLLLDFYSVGSLPFNANGIPGPSVETDLTLLVMFQNFRPGGDSQAPGGGDGGDDGGDIPDEFQNDSGKAQSDSTETATEAVTPSDPSRP